MHDWRVACFGTQEAITVQASAGCKCNALAPIRGLLLPSSGPTAARHREAFCESFLKDQERGLAIVKGTGSDHRCACARLVLAGPAVANRCDGDRLAAGYEIGDRDMLA